MGYTNAKALGVLHSLYKERCMFSKLSLAGFYTPAPKYS